MDKYLSPEAYIVWKAQWEIFIKIGCPLLTLYGIGSIVYLVYKARRKYGKGRESKPNE